MPPTATPRQSSLGALAQPAGRIPEPRRAHSGPYQSGRLPHTEALPLWPGPGATHGVRRAGFGARALHCFWRARRFRLRGRRSRCTKTSRPRFARRSRLTRFWGPLRRRCRRRVTPPRPARRAAPSSAATGYSTAGAVAGASGPAQRGARRLPAECAVRGGGRGAAGHPAHAPPVALAALPTVNWSLPGPRAHCAKHVQARHPRDGATWRIFPEFSVERLRPQLRRLVRLGGHSDVGPPPPAAGPGGVAEHEVQELLKFEMRHGRRPYVLVRWTGLDAAGDTWEPLDNLTNCEDAVAAFEQATARSLPRPAPPLPAGTAVAPPPIPPTDFTVEAAPPVDLGAALVGRTSTGCPTMAGNAVRSSLLPARRLLGRGGLPPADVGAARHGGHAPRRRLLWLPLGASLAGPGGGCSQGPSTRPPRP